MKKDGKTSVKIEVTFLSVILALGSAASPRVCRGQSEFYVSPAGKDTNKGTTVESPFATIERARDAVRQLSKADRFDGPVTVYLGGGLHRRAKGIVFTPEDSGTAQSAVTYTAYGDEKPVISGGRQITGWRKHEGAVWKAELPDVKAGRWKFRQLYVNGQQRKRARIPNEGFLRVAGICDGFSAYRYDEDRAKSVHPDRGMTTNGEEIERVI